jgi:hypothetical protein
VLPGEALDGVLDVAVGVVGDGRDEVEVAVVDGPCSPLGAEHPASSTRAASATAATKRERFTGRGLVVTPEDGWRGRTAGTSRASPTWGRGPVIVTWPFGPSGAPPPRGSSLPRLRRRLRAGAGRASRGTSVVPWNRLYAAVDRALEQPLLRKLRVEFIEAPALDWSTAAR